MRFRKNVVTMATALACVLGPGWLQAEEVLPVVDSVRVFRTADNDIAVEISASRKVEHKSYKMPDLLRVVVDLPGTEPVKPELTHRYKSIIISDIRLEKKRVNEAPVTRVSINLAEDADYEVREDSADPAKLRVILTRRAPGPGAVTAAAVPGKVLPAKGAENTFSPGKPAALTVDPAKEVSAPAVPAAAQGVAVTGIKCDADAIEIVSSSGIGEFESFALRHPGRLVVDIPGAQSTLRSVSLPANRFGASKARVGMFEGKLRIVLDSGKDPFPAHDLVKAATGLRVVPKP